MFLRKISFISVNLFVPTLGSRCGGGTKVCAVIQTGSPTQGHPKARCSDATRAGHTVFRTKRRGPHRREGECVPVGKDAASELPAHVTPAATLGVTLADAPPSPSHPPPRPPLTLRPPMARRSAPRATSERARTRQSPPAGRAPRRHWLPRPSIRSRPSYHPPSAPLHPAPLPCHRGTRSTKGAAASPFPAISNPGPPSAALPGTGTGAATAQGYLSPAQLHPNEAPTPHSGALNSRPRPGVWRQHVALPWRRRPSPLTVNRFVTSQRRAGRHRADYAVAGAWAGGSPAVCSARAMSLSLWTSSGFYDHKSLSGLSWRWRGLCT
ncbi:wiskott-Aldrich syndrome protein homolog 1-like isoform X3 [Piliocolobus tephrosceles]|uniref:wiskott-Aldrich syndrome protein homolog 1-like isoform X3 n=2 Tax=Piliocolobus tephrosceles TaxID=591936 RepID=UPI000C29876F|nr:wiskott-Aldrich syndrome protein homolog 1-like isoform X3 [Piliocolobus tephrosceles]XP_023082263.1 wiskott-Aldrich syndrome protein homolog 1-like isoform X3 [Piliocolobus tephrosceles]XP_023082264.1 wiskott-Aldrich syndrome protein homolog 1-like isoform X3 [Piliocolobus tephrosceles]